MITKHIAAKDKEHAEKLMETLLKDGQKGKLIFLGRKFGLSSYKVEIKK